MSKHISGHALLHVAKTLRRSAVRLRECSRHFDYKRRWSCEKDAIACEIAAGEIERAIMPVHIEIADMPEPVEVAA